MHAYYSDIRNRIKEEPAWFDSNGVPRYDKFEPDMSPNIYAEEVVLLEISCQDCGSKFLVEMDWWITDQLLGRHMESFTTVMREYLKKEERNWSPIHFGDPPAHGCVGDTMNCIDLRIVEFWRKEKFEWRRVPEYEIELEKEE